MNLRPLLLLLPLLLLPAGSRAAEEAFVPPPPGEEAGWSAAMVDVGGYRLHLRYRRGTAPVTILFEAGGGADLTSWGEVPERLARLSDVTVVAYDRAGLGESEIGPLDLSPQQEVASVRRALTGLGLPPRTIVVAHSYGAMLALLQAQVSSEVVGLVLVDPMNPRFAVAQREFLESTLPDLSAASTDRELALRRMAASFTTLGIELSEVEPRLELPMVILTAGEAWWGDPEIDGQWRRSHQAMADVAPQRSLVVAEGSQHDIPRTAPELVVTAVLELIDGTPESGDSGGSL